MPQPIRRGPFVVCPKSGKVIDFQPVSWIGRAFFALLGFFALGWYLARVVPKPDRALYPCQRVAAPLALGFLTYLVSLLATVTAARKTVPLIARKRYVPALACIGVALFAGAWFLRLSSPDAEAGNEQIIGWKPTEGVDKPIGVGRGIFPGRVVWVRDPSATLWNGNTGHWWDTNATNQGRVDAMLSQSLRSLTGAKDDVVAWNALFRSYNKSHGKGDAGYAKGQTIAIKINQNTARNGHAENGNPGNQNSINGNPHLILALLGQLINKAGVAPEDIYVYDISRYIADNIFVPCHAAFPRVHFVEDEKGGGEGREAVPSDRLWAKDVITYADPQRGLGRDLPPFLVQASYMINMAIMKNHGDVGPTLLAKNHFGTVHGINHGAIAHKAMGESNPLVDLLAHKEVGEKTVLFMIDTLYAADGPDATPRKWKLAPFGTAESPGWPASVFVSQDGVALDSVGFDFINAEWGVWPYTDNFLHEAALANNPPSGKKYGPVSLGVHEHWNNADEKKYSRNLGTGQGIELVPIFFPAAPKTVLIIPAKGRVDLSWPASAGAVRYNVKRALAAGGPYTNLASPTTTSYRDDKVENGKSYYYVVSTVNALGESQNSAEVSARPGAFVAAINAGGGAAAQFSADANFTGGATSSTKDYIDTTGLVAPAPQEVYQTDRWGRDIRYSLDNLTPGAKYTVRLHFVEFFFGEAGKRVFNISINGAQVLANFDIIEATRAKNKAIIKEFVVAADANGQIFIQFDGVKDNPKCSGIEVLANDV